MCLAVAAVLAVGRALAGLAATRLGQIVLGLVALTLGPHEIVLGVIELALHRIALRRLGAVELALTLVDEGLFLDDGALAVRDPILGLAQLFRRGRLVAVAAARVGQAAPDAAVAAAAETAETAART